MSCWFFDKHKNVVMLPNIFVLIKSLLYLGNVSKVPHSVRLCCRRKGYSLYLHQKLVVSCMYRVWWMVEWWCNYKYPGTDHVLRNNCDTDNTWLQSVNVRRRLPANFRGISSSIGQQHINTICSSQHKMIIMTCRGPHYLDFLHYHGVRGTENELYYV